MFSCLPGCNSAIHQRTTLLLITYYYLLNIFLNLMDFERMFVVFMFLYFQTLFRFLSCLDIWNILSMLLT